MPVKFEVARTPSLAPSPNQPGAAQAEVQSGSEMLHCSVIVPPAPQFTYAIPHLHEDIYSKMDILALLHIRGTNSYTREIVNKELRRRLRALILGLVLAHVEEPLMAEMRESGSVFGGWEVLKIVKPTSGNNPIQTVYLIFTPRNSFTRVISFFHSVGFVRMPVDISTPGLNRAAYRDAAEEVMSLRCEATGAVVDIVESANQVACFPMLRLSNTYVMHCASPDAIFSPFVNHACQTNGYGITNPFHQTGRYRIMLPDIMELEMEVYRTLRGVTIERNPAHRFPHEDRCGRDSNCLHTVRTSSSEGCVFYKFGSEGDTAFFGVDGFSWRLGGWPCYQGGRGSEPALLRMPRFHVPFYDSDMLRAVLKFPPYDIFRQILGWDVLADIMDEREG